MGTDSTTSLSVPPVAGMGAHAMRQESSDETQMVELVRADPTQVHQELNAESHVN